MSSNTVLFKWSYQILSAFNFLSINSIVHRYLHLKNFCVTPNGSLKVNNYGLFHMSEHGYCVNFPIVNMGTLSPECLILEYLYGNKEVPGLNREENIELNNVKSDVWAIGAILFQFFFGFSSQTGSSQKQLGELLAPERIVKMSLDILKTQKYSGYEFMLQLYQVDVNKQQTIETKIHPVLIELLKKCLVVIPSQRPSFEELLKFLEKFLSSSNELKFLVNKDENLDLTNTKYFDGKIRSDCLPMRSSEKEIRYREEQANEDHLWKRGVDEVYYLWRLAGGDCYQTLKQNGRLSMKLMPIHKLPMLLTVEDGCEYGKPFDDEILFDDKIVSLSLQQLRNRLSSVKPESYYPILEKLDSEHDGKIMESNFKRKNIIGSVLISASLSKSQNLGNLSSIETTQKQPLNIRETDIEYQFHRIIIFSRYLNGYPFKKQELYKECLVDIPPIYRGSTWASLLEVRSDIESVYAEINKEVITSTDRQIDVDIPRCHQYDPLMASPEAHHKLKRVLKAWVLSNPHLVYWQGLDSLCAPFLYLNFNNEAIAYGSLNNFVNKYAAKFFFKDNSAVIHEYLAVFSHLIAFHDPELANHFESIDFRPDLYAIPWFLTMFAHVFPLYKIFHLWDTLLLGSSSFPLCIGVAILRQLRNILLNSDFNECILLFSELPEINIAKCVTDTIEIFSWTPSSCLYRQHSISPLVKETPSVENPELDMTPIELSQLRLELCPHISVRDVLKLFDRNLSKLILVDIRPESEFSQFNVINSKNISFENLNFTKLQQLSQSQVTSANENDANSYLIYLLQQNKNLLKIIMTSESKFKNGIDLANELVRLGNSKICILHNGVECFKSTKIFYSEI